LRYFAAKIQLYYDIHKFVNDYFGNSPIIADEDKVTVLGIKITYTYNVSLPHSETLNVHFPHFLLSALQPARVNAGGIR
jgi:hypothetical protein